MSAISFWENSIKLSLGKLSIEPFNTKLILEACKKQGFELLDLDASDALNGSDLPLFDSHKDSFDRMLIYQCLKRDYIFITKDEKMKFYEPHGLELFWE